MQYLIDSHVFIWFFSDATNLSKKAKKILLDQDNEIFLSVASIWELGLKHKLGKLQIPESPREYILSRANRADIKFLPIQASHTFSVNELSLLHRDPFDRIIIAQAKENELLIVSNDAIFDEYKVNRIW